jgi:hypothetical protein
VAVIRTLFVHARESGPKRLCGDKRQATTDWPFEIGSLLPRSAARGLQEERGGADLDCLDSQEATKGTITPDPGSCWCGSQEAKEGMHLRYLHVLPLALWRPRLSGGGGFRRALR